MTPDHTEPNRAAPETYDRDWFLAQLNGRDPHAPRESGALEGEGADTWTASESNADADLVAAVKEPKVHAGLQTARDPLPEMAEEPEYQADLPAPTEPETEVDAESTSGDVDDEVFPVPSLASRGRRAGALVGAVVGLVLVGSVAFAASVVRQPTDPAGAENRPAMTETHTPVSTNRTGTPAPQSTTSPFAGDAPRNSGSVAHDEGNDPVYGGNPAGPPPSSSDPTSTNTTPPAPGPTLTGPEPTSTGPDPGPTSTGPTSPDPSCLLNVEPLCGEQ